MYATDARHPNPGLQQKLQALYELRGGPTIDLTIRKPYMDLLAALGDPHKHLPPVIHVAGTNGKGSVIAMLRSIFEAAGYKAHVYTSPHLVRFNERIVIAGREIADGPLEELLDEATRLNEGSGLTFFEITTAMALSAFARYPADICLLETGLGGRLDCTNIVEKPAATIITRIGYDHMEFLGNSLEKIAAEKAGILKPRVPCILAPQENPVIEQVIAAKAAELGCPVYKTDPAAGAPTNMAGSHQRDNAATATTCVRLLTGFDIPETALQQGLKNVRWPARLQRLNIPVLPEGAELWIDGAHNESAANALGAQAAHWAKSDCKPLHIVLAMMKRKDPVAFMAPLRQYADKITCVAIPGEPGAFSPQELAAVLGGTHINVTPSFENVLRNNIQPGERVLIIGSLYLAGLVLSHYG